MFQEMLKVMELKNFSGGLYELYILMFLIQCVFVLDIVDLYVPNGLVGVMMSGF